MNVMNMIAELRTERENVSQAILVLERIAAGRGRRRGRPPLWMSQIKLRAGHRGARTRRSRKPDRHSARKYQTDTRSDRLEITVEARMAAFIFPFLSIPWTIGVPFILLVVGGIVVKTKLAEKRQSRSH
jgi:hypothetical protein